MNFPANTLSGAIHPAFSTNHLADNDKTKHNHSQQQHQNQNNHAGPAMHRCSELQVLLMSAADWATWNQWWFQSKSCVAAFLVEKKAILPFPRLSATMTFGIQWPNPSLIISFTCWHAKYGCSKSYHCGRWHRKNKNFKITSTVQQMVRNM